MGPANSWGSSEVCLKSRLPSSVRSDSVYPNVSSPERLISSLSHETRAPQDNHPPQTWRRQTLSALREGPAIPEMVHTPYRLSGLRVQARSEPGRHLGVLDRWRPDSHRGGHRFALFRIHTGILVGKGIVPRLRRRPARVDHAAPKRGRRRARLLCAPPPESIGRRVSSPAR